MSTDLSRSILGTAADLSLRRKITVIGMSLFRTVLGVVLIFAVLTLLPSTFDRSAILPYLLLIVAMSGYIAFFQFQMRRIAQSRFPQLRVIEALILSATLFLSIYAGLYSMLSGTDTSAFSEQLSAFDGLYFALTVLSTVGFGDIVPVSDAARAITMSQMAIGIGFVAIAVKSLFSAARRAETQRKSAQGSS